MRLAVLAAVAVLALPGRAPGQSASMDELLAQEQAVGEAPFDVARKPEPGYLDAYRASQHELYRKRAKLILQACRAAPEDPRVPDLMNRRWELLAWNQPPADVADEVLADVEAVLATATEARVRQ